MCIPIDMIKWVLYDKSQNEFETGSDEEEDYAQQLRIAQKIAYVLAQKTINERNHKSKTNV